MAVDPRLLTPQEAEKIENKFMAKKAELTITQEAEMKKIKIMRTGALAIGAIAGFLYGRKKSAKMGKQLMFAGIGGLAIWGVTYLATKGGSKAITESASSNPLI